MTDKDFRRFVFALLAFSPFLAPLGAADLPSGPLDAPSAPPAESPRAPLRASFSMDVASAYFFDSGYVVDEGPVVQPAFGVSDGRAFLPLKFAFWGNYALEREAPMSDDKGFTEIDLSVGTEHAFRNGVVLFADLKTSQYPAMEGWSGVDFVNAKLQRRFGPVLLGGRMKYLMSGGYANDVQLIPFGEVSAPVVADVTAGLHAQACYNFNEGAAADAWTACTITARLSWRALSLYVKRAVQMDDAIYTDRQHAVERVIVGAGWRRSW